MRLRGRDGIARALYFAKAGRRLCVVRVFVKKTQKTPRAGKSNWRCAASLRS